MPALRDRPEDIGVLVRHFLRELPQAFSIRAFRALFLWKWPGNVRQLGKTVQMARILGDGHGMIDIEDLPMQPGQAVVERPGDGLRASFGRPTSLELGTLLQRHRGNVGGVARELGRQRTLVWRWLRRDGLDPASFRDGSGDN